MARGPTAAITKARGLPSTQSTCRGMRCASSQPYGSRVKRYDEWQWRLSMAFEFECKRCGHQEATHAYRDQYPGCCKRYVSPNRRLERKLWAEARGEGKSRKADGPINHSVWLVTPFGTIDIGS